MDISSARVLGDVYRANAALYPTKTALISHSGEERSFGAFNQRVNRLNHALGARGAEKGDRVAVLSRNSIEYMEIYGLGKMGLVIVALNWRLVAADIAKLIRHCAPRVLVADPSHAELIDGLREELDGVSLFILIGGQRAGWQSYESLIAAAPDDEPSVQVSPDDVMALIYTSGTTGAPKGVAVTHRTVLDNAFTVAHPLLSLSSEDIVMAVMPLFHSGGMWYHAFPSQAAGCTLVVLPEFDPAVVLSSLERRRVTYVHLVPTMIAALIDHPLAQSTDLSALRLIFYAASSMPVDLLMRAMARLQGCEFVQSYGATESGVLTVLTPADHARARQNERHLLRSCGRALDHREIRILAADDEIQPPEKLGEIAIRSPGAMQGYWRDEPATRRISAGDGWLR
ncbi:MAG: AMP-binding protein, partial [Pseudomonadota bacterium]|nr:AMP-binding protein [Pseudomonadota bacterium]